MRRLVKKVRSVIAVAAVAWGVTGHAAGAQHLSWTGLYLGGHIGGSWGDLNGADLDGFAAGLHGGYNLQNGNIVYGIEADLSFSSADAHGSQIAGGCLAFRGGGCAVPLTVATNAAIDLDWLGSLRARLGFTTGNLMIYGTGGIGWGNVDLKVSGAGLGSSSSSNTHVGFVAGAGAEMKLARNWSGRAELLYYGLGSETYSIVGTTTKLDLDTTVLRAGLTYHFN
jgi:outer membrane immunogenic protein